MLEKRSGTRFYTAADPAPKSIERKRLPSFEYLDTTGKDLRAFAPDAKIAGPTHLGTVLEPAILMRSAE